MFLLNPLRNSCARLPAVSTVCLAVLSTPPIGAHAQTIQPLAPVVITASRNSQPLDDALPHTTVISREDIDNAQAPDLGSLLAREAGVQLTQNGGPGTTSTLFLRGAPSLQVLVLVDGVPMTRQDATGSIGIEHLMLDQIDHIEIVRGNVSAIYGSGAIGGVIQIFTRKGDGPIQPRMALEAGSRGTQRFSGGLDGRSGDTRFAVSASSFRTTGFSAENPAQIENVNPDRDGYRNTSWSAALTQTLAPGHSVSLTTTHSSGSFGYDVGGSFASATDVHTGKALLDSSTISSSNQFTPAWLSRLSYSQSRDVNRTDNQTAFPYQDRYVTRNRVVSWVNSVTLAPKWLLTVGAEQQRQSVDTDDGFGDLYAKTRTVKALFAGVQGTGGPHGLQLNLRRDDVAELGAKSTAYVGYGYLLGSGFKLIASWSSAFNAPPLGYLYAPYFGNPDLKPELARSAELGVQWTGPGQQVRSTLFTTRTRDQLSYDFDTSRFENLARTRNQGLETSYTGTVAQTHINASLTLQHPTDDITGQRLRRRATTLASVSANRAFGSWQVGASLRYASGRPDGANALAAYTLADLTARYAVAKGLEVTARVENLFDRVYQTAYGYNQPPRGVFAGLVWSPAR